MKFAEDFPLAGLKPGRGVIWVEIAVNNYFEFMRRVVAGVIDVNRAVGPIGVKARHVPHPVAVGKLRAGPGD